MIPNHTRTLLSAALLLGGILTCTTPASAVTWIAGADLAANESPDGPQELINPNPTVPQRSHGYRSTILGTAFTPNLAGDHINDNGGYAGWDGWGGTGNILVNTNPTPLTVNFGYGPWTPLGALDISTHPAATEVTVVRWTAPVSGSFSISAYWYDVDHYTFSGADGASGNVIVNGSSVFGTSFGNGGSTSTSQTLLLSAGDFVDFVVGRNGNIAHDTTGFNATIIGAPEPSRALLLLLGLAGATMRRKRK